jgi:kumamolisin
MAAVAVAALLMPIKASAQSTQAMNRAAVTQSVEFDVLLPSQHTDELDTLLEEQQNPHSTNYHKWLTPDQFRARFGPSSNDLAVLSQTLSSYGFAVIGTHSHGVRARATVGAVQRAFGVSLWNAATPSGQFRVIAAEPLNLPPALRQMGAHIVHFSKFQLHSQARRVTAAIPPENRVSPYGRYWLDDLKQAYDFPS